MGYHHKYYNRYFLPQAKTVHFGHDSLRYFGVNVWNLIPEELRQIDVESFKQEMK